MGFVETWGISILVVLGLAGGTMGFAARIGRWIDNQGNTVVDEPKERRKVFKGEE